MWEVGGSKVMEPYQMQIIAMNHFIGCMVAVLVGGAFIYLIWEWRRGNETRA